MNHVAVRPSSLEGIKRLAKSIKRERGITHTQALDAAAQGGGFQNLRHAQNCLAIGVGSASAVGKHNLYFTAYWRDERGGSGRETLHISLSSSLAMIGTARKITQTGALQRFKVDAVDHLEYIHDVRDQHAARDVVCKAARTIIFMEASGLVPATSLHRTLVRRIRDLRGLDHVAVWVHPATDIEVVSDEPFADEELLEERAPTLAERGLYGVAPAWSGMYSPGNSTLFLTADNESFLKNIAKRLAQVRIQPIAERWSGESAPYAPAFVSPGRQATGVRKKGRPRPIVAGKVRNGALPYQMMPWTDIEWRPATKMPIKVHAEIGGILQALIERPFARARTMSAVEVVRLNLDEWVQREYSKRQLSDERRRRLYYGHRDPTLPAGLTPRAALARIRWLLSKHYEDCVPLRSTVRRLSTAERWAK